MPLQITGRHLTVSDADKSYIEKKIKRIRRHFDRIDEVNVTIGAEKLDRTVEIELRAGTIRAFVKTSNSKVRTAIDRAVDKLEQQVVKAKEKRAGNKKHSRPPALRTVEEVED